MLLYRLYFESEYCKRDKEIAGPGHLCIAAFSFNRSTQPSYNLIDLTLSWEQIFTAVVAYKELITKLGMKKIRLSLSEKAEWEDYFLQESKKAKEIKTRIEATDREIDQWMVVLPCWRGLAILAS